MDDAPESEWAPSPGVWVAPDGVRPGWNWVPETGARFAFHRLPIWLRALVHAPMIDRHAYVWAWFRGGFDVAKGGDERAASSLPSDEAYGRVTDPERYQALHDTAFAVLTEFETSYDVERTDGVLDAHATGMRPGPLAVRIVPLGAGAPLTVTFTSLPGVILEAGWAWRSSYPSCGCDACAQDPDELAADLASDLRAIAEGGLTEGRRRNRWFFGLDRFTQSLAHASGERSSWGSVDPSDPNDRIPRGVTDWSAWPPIGDGGFSGGSDRSGAVPG